MENNFGNRPIQIRGEKDTGRVWLFDKELDHENSLSYVRHSPSGFSWGYNGSGPSQLAFAICLELFGEQVAREVYMEFREKYIAVIHQSDFEIDITLENFYPTKTSPGVK